VVSAYLLSLYNTFINRILIPTPSVCPVSKLTFRFVCKMGTIQQKNTAMITIAKYNQNTLPDVNEEKEVIRFLFQELEQYGDPEHQIQKAADYALGRDGKLGGWIFVAKENNNIVSAVIINETGMSEYIPENILVYIATDREQRGKGIGKKIMQEVIAHTQGDIALHVDKENPARKLYERLGFTTPFLEMRLTKEA